MLSKKLNYCDIGYEKHHAQRQTKCENTFEFISDVLNTPVIVCIECNLRCLVGGGQIESEVAQIRSEETTFVLDCFPHLKSHSRDRRMVHSDHCGGSFRTSLKINRLLFFFILNNDLKMIGY